MIHQVDKYLAQPYGKELPRAPGSGPALPVFPDRTAMPDDYHSAGEPSEFEYDSKETDPEDDPKEDDASVASNLAYKSSRHDTDQTRKTNILNCNHRCNQRKCKEH